MSNRIKKINLETSISIPNRVSIKSLNNIYIFEGPYGSISHLLDKSITATITPEKIIINTKINKLNKKTKRKALFNTISALFKNYIHGVLNLFEKTILIKGIGYKVEYKNSKLNLSLGYSHNILYDVPNDIIINLTPNSISVKGISKHKVGHVAHEIKMKKPADIYKGNGLMYKDEKLILKSPKKTK